MDLPAALLATLLAGPHGTPASPPLSDLERLPPRAVARGWLDFADEHQRRLCRGMRTLEKAGLGESPEWWRLARWCCEVEARSVKWRLLGRATDPALPGPDRRAALRRLWWCTTWDEYYHGALAPPAPLEFFAEMP
jgi:hypothetical protein